jgi:hypothetical protein
MSDTFDTPNPATLSADITAVALLDNDGNPNRVIDTDTGFKVRVDWSISGSMVPLLGGDWQVRLLVESIGSGFEGQVGAATVPLDGSTNYSTTIAVGPGVPPPPPGPDTVYKLVALISHTNFGVKSEMAGFGEGPYFEVRRP